MSYKTELEFAKNLAEEAGEIMREFFDSAAQATVWKEDKTPLTVADDKINQLVIQRVKAKYPDHGVLGEEDSYSTDAKFLWVCDPIDGTFPFAHGMPISTFNLALTVDGLVQAAVCFDPFMGRLYSAERGQGAYLNGKKLDISKTKLGGRPGIEFCVWGGKGLTVFADPKIDSKARALLSANDYFVFFLVSVAYSASRVASGEVAAAVFGGRGAWDGAAVSLIGEEAGAIVTDITGQKDQLFNGPTNGFIVAHPAIYPYLAETIIPYFKEAKKL